MILEWQVDSVAGREEPERIGDAFPCTACGACCRSLGGSSLYAGLDRGDGVCQHLDEGSNLCRIYEARPSAYRVSDM